jgi:hypothetical protein
VTKTAFLWFGIGLKKHTICPMDKIDIDPLLEEYENESSPSPDVSNSMTMEQSHTKMAIGSSVEDNSNRMLRTAGLVRSKSGN